MLPFLQHAWRKRMLKSRTDGQADVQAESNITYTPNFVFGEECKKLKDFVLARMKHREYYEIYNNTRESIWPNKCRCISSRADP